MGADSRIPLRILAPASLVLFAIVLLIVVVSSLGGDSGSSSTSATPSPGTRNVRTRDNPDRLASRRVYIVRSGDTLAGIADRTGVAVDRLVALNPTVDPQGLVTGQRIKLRE